MTGQNESVTLGIYVNDAGDKFACHYFPVRKTATVVKMPHLTTGNSTGVGRHHCEVIANSKDEAKTAIEKELGPGSW